MRAAARVRSVRVPFHTRCWRGGRAVHTPLGHRLLQKYQDARTISATYRLARGIARLPSRAEAGGDFACASRDIVSNIVSDHKAITITSAAAASHKSSAPLGRVAPVAVPKPVPVGKPRCPDRPPPGPPAPAPELVAKYGRGYEIASPEIESPASTPTARVERTPLK